MKKSLFLFAFLGLSLFAQEGDVDFDNQLNRDEIRALRDWINTKRQVSIRERGGNLSIAGEVRTEYQNRKETLDGIRQIGPGGVVSGTASDAFDVEVNLMFDYRTDRTWAAVKLEFDNNAGTSSGTFNRLSLERAYLGGRLVSRDTFTIDAEIGRRNFSNVFDSRIQFGSFMDGVVLKYDQGLDPLGDIYLYGGPFLIDERDNHYGYVGELGILNMFGTGLYLKYSLIDWDTKDFSDPLEEDRFRFLNSQVTLGYRIRPKWLNKNIIFYTAGLLNSAAKPLPVTSDTRARYGWYAGLSAGEVRKRGDWSFDINYQQVAAQAVPGFDSAGIGRGNAARTGLYTVNSNGSGGAQTRENAVGSNNFKGVAAEFLYLLTNNLTLYQSYAQSWTLNKNIGPNLQFRQYELEFIYAF